VPYRQCDSLRRRWRLEIMRRRKFRSRTGLAKTKRTRRMMIKAERMTKSTRRISPKIWIGEGR
jgi:hypothetical protein